MARCAKFLVVAASAPKCCYGETDNLCANASTQIRHSNDSIRDLRRNERMQERTDHCPNYGSETLQTLLKSAISREQFQGILSESDLRE